MKVCSCKMKDDLKMIIKRMSLTTGENIEVMISARSYSGYQSKEVASISWPEQGEQYGD